MEDLELQLGDLRTNYMEVRVSYSHSAFPSYADADSMSGISTIQSTMNTTAAATLKQYNGLSPWSPYPAPAPNTLFQLIAQHWGNEKATEAMQKMLSQRSTPRKPAKGGGCVSPETTPAATPNPTPSRSTRAEIEGLQGWIGEQLDGSAETHAVEPADELSPAPTLSSQPSFSLTVGKRCSARTRLDPSSSDLSGLSYESDMYRREPSETSSGRRRPIVMDPFRSLFPGLSGGEADGRDRPSLGATVRAKRKELSRWGWASWF